MAAPKKPLTPYQKFLKDFKLKSNEESATLFKRYQNAVQTNRRGAASAPVAPGGEGLNKFRVDERGITFNNLKQGRPEDTLYGITENAYLEGHFGPDQTVIRAPFWVSSVRFGYGSSGVKAQSKFYSSYYAHNFQETPLSITGRVPSEDYIADFSEWIRASQVQIALGRQLLKLSIPSAKIHSTGFVAGFTTEYKSGFEPAPEISFDFIVTAKDANAETNSEYSQKVIAYFLHPDDHYWGATAQKFTEDIYSGIESDLLKNFDRRIQDIIKRDQERAKANEIRRNAEGVRGIM